MCGIFILLSIIYTSIRKKICGFFFTVPLHILHAHIYIYLYKMLRSSFSKASPVFPRLHRCLATVQTSKPATKRTGDISDSFVSLSGGEQAPLPDRFRQLKLDLVRDREKDIIAGWKRLLRTLREENEIIDSKGTAVIPQVEFSDLDSGLDSKVKEEIKKRGVVVVNGVIPERKREDIRSALRNTCTRTLTQEVRLFPEEMVFSFLDESAWC